MKTPIGSLAYRRHTRKRGVSALVNHHSPALWNGMNASRGKSKRPRHFFWAARLPGHQVGSFGPAARTVSVLLSSSFGLSTRRAGNTKRPRHLARGGTTCPLRLEDLRRGLAYRRSLAAPLLRDVESGEYLRKQPIRRDRLGQVSIRPRLSTFLHMLGQGVGRQHEYGCPRTPGLALPGTNRANG